MLSAPITKFNPPLELEAFVDDMLPNDADEAVFRVAQMHGHHMGIGQYKRMLATQDAQLWRMQIDVSCNAAAHPMH